MDKKNTEDRIERVYTIESLAELLSCGDWKIRQMCKAGELPYFKIGNEYRFSDLAIKEWIRKQEKRNCRV